MVAVLLAAALGGAIVPLSGARASSGGGARAGASNQQAACPVLVLSAMPLEIAPILAAATLDPNPVWVSNGRGFWSGEIEGTSAIVAITGIGLRNATATTDAAFAHFSCLSAVVFSGTSGGDFIGDVMVPSRWTLDGKQFLTTSPSMMAVLSKALAQPVPLEQTTPVGDPFCLCGAPGLPSATLPVTVLHKPQVEVGGDGLSNDGFGGRTLPCTPDVSDVLGCWPCKFPDTALPTQAANLATTVPPFLDPSFALGYGAASAPPPGNYVSSDMETAAVFTIAAAHGVPYIGFRAASDGAGDPLMLPGFPSEFFVYRQLAADNAAAAALAFLSEWHGEHP